MTETSDLPLQLATGQTTVLDNDCMSNDATIGYRRVYVDLTGSVTAALLLSQIVYWSGITGDPEGWIYKTDADWYDEIGLTRRQQITAREKLSACDWYAEDRHGPRGTVRYRVDLEALEADVQIALNAHSYDNQIVQNVQPDDSQNARNVQPDDSQNARNVQPDDNQNARNARTNGNQNARNVHSNGNQNVRNVQTDDSQNVRNARTTSRETCKLNQSERAKRTFQNARNARSPYTEITTEITDTETTTEINHHHHRVNREGDVDGADGGGGGDFHPQGDQVAKVMAAWTTAEFEPEARMMKPTIAGWITEYGVDDVLAAMRTTFRNKAKTPASYVETVLQNGRQARIESERDQAEAADLERDLLDRMATGVNKQPKAEPRPEDSRPVEPLSEQDAFWAEVMAELERNMNWQVYDQFVSGMTLLSCEDDEYVIGLADASSIDWVQNRFTNTLRQTLGSRLGRPVQVRFEVASEAAA